MNPEARAAALFRAEFGEDPAVTGSAAGRVNLIGEHVDYHGGHVLPMAIAERVAVAVGPADGTVVGVTELPGAPGFGADAPPARATPLSCGWPSAPGGGWIDYVAGVARFLADAGAANASGLRCAVASDVPVGAGLSSSAALEVASAAGLSALWGLSLSPRALAHVAHRAETEFVGVPCGVMDQIAVALATGEAALLLDCRTHEVVNVPVGVDLVLVESGESRALRKGPYAERRREGEAALAALREIAAGIERLVDVPPAMLARMRDLLPPPLDRRVRHVVNENQRTLLAARALEAGDLKTFGAHVNASHDSLRDLYECSTPRLDAIVRAARALPGVLGARLVGAGWGGAVLVVVEPGRGDEVARGLAADGVLGLPAVRRVRPGSGPLVTRG